MEELKLPWQIFLFMNITFKSLFFQYVYLNLIFFLNLKESQGIKPRIFCISIETVINTPSQVASKKQ